MEYKFRVTFVVGVEAWNKYDEDDDEVFDYEVQKSYDKKFEIIHNSVNVGGMDLQGDAVLRRSYSIEAENCDKAEDILRKLIEWNYSQGCCLEDCIGGYCGSERKTCEERKKLDAIYDVDGKEDVLVFPGSEYDIEYTIERID